MRFEDLGIVPYREGERIQQQAVDDVQKGGEERVFLLEHEPTVTLGRRAGNDHLLVPESVLEKQGIAFIRSTRGGDITCHYPGQLVAYPIMRIDRRPGGLKLFFHDLEEAVIRTVASFGVTAGRVEGRTGVWVDETRKICSIGIAVRHWVTWHGLSLNVGPDLSLFQSITLCGLPDAQPASLCVEAHQNITMQDVKNVFTGHFRKLFTDTTVAAY